MKIFLRPGNIIVVIRAFFSFFVLFPVTQSLEAQTIYYVQPGGTGSGTGSWSNAAGVLQAVIDAASSGSQIWVKVGTYSPITVPTGSTGGSGPHDFSFALKNGVAIYGGFAGTETTLSQRDPLVNPTILASTSGNSNTCYHVVVSVNNDNTAILDGFTIQSGNANGTGTITYKSTTVDRSYGGGIYCNNSSLLISNCLITNNKGTNGAGMATLGGSVNIRNTQIISNVAVSFGGAMYNSSAAPVVSSCSITDNRAPIGGAMFNDGGAGIYTDDNISSNTANTTSSGMGGGAMCNNGANPTLVRCLFIADVASAGADGGAIYNNGASPVDSNCIFQADIAKLGNGGAIYNNGGNSECWNCLFVTNSSNLNGGAVYIASGNSKFINSTLSKNKATFGGSSGVGGGIYIASGNPVVSNDIIWGGSSGLVVAGGSPVVQYNDIQDGAYTTNGNISADPLFINDSNAPGADGIWATGDDGLQLINGPNATFASPAINTGTSAAGGSINYDLLYVGRPVGPGIDMGAYEAPLPTTLGIMSLLNFTAITSGPHAALLQWHVDAQQQANAYEVQRSEKGHDFTGIGTLNTVRDKTDYSFTDDNAGSGNIFYRLKWLQDDSKPAYSIEVMINHSQVTGCLSLRPSVVENGNTVLFLLSSSRTDMEIGISDISGRLYRRQTVAVDQGENQLPLDLRSFASGVYYLNVSLKNGFHQVVAFVKL